MLDFTQAERKRRRTIEGIETAVFQITDDGGWLMGSDQILVKLAIHQSQPPLVVPEPPVIVSAPAVVTE